MESGNALSGVCGNAWRDLMNETETEFTFDLEENGIHTECVREMSERELNVIFLLDTSGSMYGTKIHQLNTAMPIILEAIRDVASECEAELLIRVIEFNTDAKWIIGDETNRIDGQNITWTDLSAGGGTDTADAIRLAVRALCGKRFGMHYFHPIVILVTDGESNDPSETHAAIEELKAALNRSCSASKDTVWRLAIGVEDYNESELLDFAMTGTLEDDFGYKQENAPMVFPVDDMTDFMKFMKAVAVSSARSSCMGEEKPIIEI